MAKYDMGTYDADLAMFITPPRDPDLNVLKYLRWMAEHWLLEHEVCSPPTGEYATKEEVS